MLSVMFLYTVWKWPQYYVIYAIIFVNCRFLTKNVKQNLIFHWFNACKYSHSSSRPFRSERRNRTIGAVFGHKDDVRFWRENQTTLLWCNKKVKVMSAIFIFDFELARTAASVRAVKTVSLRKNLKKFTVTNQFHWHLTCMMFQET